jgi:hypothetical protein
MTERDEAEAAEADAAAAALAHSGLDELKRVAYSRPSSPEEAARSVEAQRLLAAHEERQAEARERERADARARDASDAAEPAHPLHDDARLVPPHDDEQPGAAEARAGETGDEPRPVRRRVAVVVAALVAAAAAAALAVVLVANPGFDIVESVTGDPAPGPSESPTLPPPDPDYMNEVRDSLGPVPRDGAMSAKDVDAVLKSMADWDWQNLTAQYPDAVRPDVDVIRVLEGHERSAVQVDCLVARGIDARVSSGDSYTYSGSTEAEMLSVYRCAVEYPTRPPHELTTRQVGYFYDYLVQFAVPCLERLGYEQTTPPLREKFVDAWPEQIWSADAGPVTSSKTSRAVAAACPPTPEGLF